MGLTGYAGIARMWDTFVFAAYEKRMLLQVLIRDGRTTRISYRERWCWEDDTMSGVAQYFLLFVPNVTYLNVWGNGFSYGSGNTVAGVSWFESGVPMNAAYQPSVFPMKNQPSVFPKKSFASQDQRSDTFPNFGKLSYPRC
jgi:hypothetical protein